MAVTIDDVRHVASLARLGLTDDRAESLVVELNTILGHMAALSKVPTAGVEPSMAGAAEGLALRSDKGPPFALDREPMDFAPNMRDGFLLVPRLSTHESGDES